MPNKKVKIYIRTIQHKTKIIIRTRLHFIRRQATWPWPWPDNLDIRNWPRYPDVVPAYKCEPSMWRFRKSEHLQPKTLTRCILGLIKLKLLFLKTHT